MTAFPRVKTNGYKPSYKKEYSMSFGTFCEVFDSPVHAKDAQLHSRSCLALFPIRNRQGSWQFLNLNSLKIVTSGTWVSYPQIPFSVLEKLKKTFLESKKQNESKNLAKQIAKIKDLELELLLEQKKMKGFSSRVT